jgi:hypothetical protein
LSELGAKINLLISDNKKYSQKQKLMNKIIENQNSKIIELETEKIESKLKI